jgi:hypothetical protein
LPGTAFERPIGIRHGEGSGCHGVITMLGDDSSAGSDQGRHYMASGADAVRAHAVHADDAQHQQEQQPGQTPTRGAAEHQRGLGAARRPRDPPAP